MKLIYSILILTIISLLTSACISRTISSSTPLGKEGIRTEKKILWIWQDEFHNP